MPTLNLDTETFSTAPIEAGHSRYWEEARVLCVAWSLDGGPVQVTTCRVSACRTCGGTGTVNTFDMPVRESNACENWPGPCPDCTWPCPPALAAALADPAVIVEGWNIAFDHRALEWLHRVHGWPAVPFARTPKWYMSRSLATSRGRPAIGD